MVVVQAMKAGENGGGSGLVTRHNSWYNLPIELDNQFGGQGRIFRKMNLDELLKSMSSAEAAEKNVKVGPGDGSQSSLSKALSKRTVDEVWKDIQEGGKADDKDVVVKSEKEVNFGEITLEDFLTKAGAYEEGSSADPVEDSSQSLSAQFTLSPAPSVGTMSDAQIVGCKRGAPENVIERKLKRKIKNRESAARSRARKQAYHNELVGKVSTLEMDNMKLKKEKDFDNLFPCGLSDGVKYQLRRTSSTSF